MKPEAKAIAAVVVFSLLIIGLVITISYAVINRRKIKKGEKNE